MKIGCGNLYITVNYDEQGICEVFTNTGRAGGCPSQSEATARLRSVALRAGVGQRRADPSAQGHPLSPSTIRQQGMAVTSCPDAIAKAIEKVMKASKNQEIPPVRPPMEPIRPQGALSPSMTPRRGQAGSSAPSAAAGWSMRAAASHAGTGGYSSVVDRFHQNAVLLKKEAQRFH